MPVGTKGTVKVRRPGRAARARRRDHARQHVPPALPPGRGPDRRARRAARVHGLGRRRSSPTPAASRSSRSATRCSRPTTTASPSARSTTAAPERFTPELAARIQEHLGSDVAMCLDICLPAGVAARRARGGGAPDDAWAQRQRDLPRAPGQLRFAITQGGLDSELRRRSSEELVALDFDGYAIGGLSVGEDREPMFDATTDAAAAPARREAALLHGDRRSGGRDRGDRARGRHVRLRAADAHGAHRQRADVGGAAQPAQRPFRARPAAARRRLRLPGLHAVQPRLHPASRQPAGDPRPAAPEPA